MESKEKARGRQRRSRAEADAIVEQYLDSGFTQEEFASRHDINVKTLRRWLRRRREQCDAAPINQARLIPVTVRHSEPSQVSELEVVLLNGRQLRIGAAVDLERVAQLVAVLDRPC